MSQMAPEELPPELMDALSGVSGAPDMGPASVEEEEPDEIEVDGGGAESDEDLIRTAIESLQQAMENESDDADSAKLARVVQMLYDLTSGRQDAQIEAMGGKPRAHRALQKAYQG